MPRRGAAVALRLTPIQKKILAIMLNGDAKTGLLMHIIRFVMPSKSKPLKKLMYFFFEVCPKHDAQGKLRQEWILVWCVLPMERMERSMLTVCK
jgi:coatomer subunit beta